MAKAGITFLIQVESALHLGQAPVGVGEYLFTCRHVPGSVLRGALAEVLIKKMGLRPESGDFQRLFDGQQAVRFEPAYPATSTDWGYPFPLTARQCKASGGFPPSDARSWERANYHGVFDILVNEVVFQEQADGLAREGRPLPFIEKPLCPRCDPWGGVEPAKGSYIWDSLSERPVAPPKVNLARHTHTAINRARGVAEDEMLYTVETIEPGALLRGCVWVEEDWVNLVRDALQGITHLGRGIRRGHGRVTVEPLEETLPGRTRARIEALTGLIRAERAFYARLTGRAVPPDDGYYFTLDLLSPAVLGNGVMATLEPGDLGLPAGTKLIRRFVAAEIVGGWWNAAGLPHPTALAAAAGSVFLYRAPLEVDLDELSAHLDTLQAKGIGRMRERGYGAVMPCAPFHLWTAEKEGER